MKRKIIKDTKGFQERALIALVKANPKTLPEGMRIEVITTKYNATSEKPHFYLFPADHTPKKGNANNYDLISRVFLSDEPPKNIEDIRAIKGNKPISEIYKKAILKWSHETDDILKINNWLLANIFWEKQTA